MAHRGRKHYSCISLAAVLLAAVLTAPGYTYFSTGESRGAQLETRTGSRRTSSARRGVTNYDAENGQWGVLLGKKVKGVVTKVNPLSANVDLGAGVMANYHVRHFTDERVDKGEDVFHVGQEVVARLNRYTGKMFELTRVDNPKAALPLGTEVRGTVTRVNPMSADVDIAGSEVPGNFHVAEFAAEHIDRGEDAFHVGQEVVALVKDFTGRRFELTRVGNPKFALPLGTEVRGTVTKVNPMSADVEIDGSEVLGNLHVADFLTDFIEKGEDVFRVGQEVVARINGFTGKDFDLTRVDNPKFALPLGTEVRGTVTKVNPLSADIDIDGSEVPGNFHVAEFAAEPIDKGEDVFHVGQEVVALIKGFTGRRFELTRVDNPKAALPLGTEVRGTVTKVNPLSADVDIDGSDVRGNFHVAQFAAERIEKGEDVFHVGQEVVARVQGFTGRMFQLTRVDDPKFAFPLGTEVRGTVTKVNPLSADVDIDGSEISGNFHISQVSAKNSAKADDVFQVGQTVTVRVKAIRGARHVLTRADHPFFLAVVEE